MQTRAHLEYCLLLYRRMLCYVNYFCLRACAHSVTNLARRREGPAMDVTTLTFGTLVRLIDAPGIVGRVGRGVFINHANVDYALVAWPYSINGLDGIGDPVNLLFVELVPATATAPESGPQWGKGSTSA